MHHLGALQGGCGWRAACAAAHQAANLSGDRPRYRSHCASQIPTPRPDAYVNASASATQRSNHLIECASSLSTGAPSPLSRRSFSDPNQRLHATIEEAEQCSFSLDICGTEQRQLFAVSDVLGCGHNGTGAAGGTNCTISNLSSGTLEALQGVQFHYLRFETPASEEKTDWMASLLSITASRIYERYLRTLPKLEIPLRLPSPEKSTYQLSDAK